MGHDCTFGAFIPQGWKMELASIDDPRADTETMRLFAPVATKFR